jgi:hypothetical protein
MKPVIYAEIPPFDQQTQAVFQEEPVEMEDCIYYGVRVVDLPDEPSEELGNQLAN